MQNTQNSKISRILVVGTGPISAAVEMAIAHLEAQGHTVTRNNPTDTVMFIRPVPTVTLDNVEVIEPKPLVAPRFVRDNYHGRSKHHQNKL